MPKANEMIVQVLEEAGVEYLFGIPGGGTGQIYDCLFGHEDKVRTILARHEQAAAIMADAYGRATGKPAAIMGQGLFMGSNAAFGIMEAFLSSTPMLVLTDTSDGGSAQHPANQSGAGEYGSVDLHSMFRAMTKYTTLATTAKEAVLGTQLAIKHATSGRQGPACVLMRSASIVGEVDLESPPFIHHTGGYLNTRPPQAGPQDVEDVVKLLAGAQKPVMVVGNGVHMAQAHGQVQQLAELWGMPVATSYKGKSAIAETHSLAVGMVGIYGQRAAATAVGEADVVIVIGAKLSPQDTVRERPNVFDPLRQHIVQIDIDARNTGWTFPVEIGLVGDAKAVLNQLVEASQPVADATVAQERTGALQRQKSSLNYFEDPELLRDSSPVLPQRLVRIMQETLDPSTLFALDAGNNRTWMAHFYKSQQPGTFFCPGGTAGMGWAPASSRCPQAGSPRLPRGRGNRRRRLHDVGPCHIDRGAVPASGDMDCAQRWRPRYGATPPSGPRDILKLRGNRPRRSSQRHGRMGCTGKRLPSLCPSPPRRRCLWPTGCYRCDHRPRPQPRRLAPRRPRSNRDLGGIGAEERTSPTRERSTLPSPSPPGWWTKWVSKRSGDRPLQLLSGRCCPGW